MMVCQTKVDLETATKCKWREVWEECRRRGRGGNVEERMGDILSVIVQGRWDMEEVRKEM